MTLSKEALGNRLLGSLSRIAKYGLIRAVLLLITVTITVYVTIVIANFGGRLDEFVKSEIEYGLGMSMRDRTDLTHEEKEEIFEQRKAAAFEAAGLNVPGTNTPSDVK